MPASLNWPVNVSVGWGHNSVYVTIGILLSRCFGVVFSLLILLLPLVHAYVFLSPCTLS